MKQFLLPAVLAALCGASLAKIPPPVLDDAAKAKAAETAAKTAWQGKIDAWQLCKSQDKVAAYYKKTAHAAPAKPAAPLPAGAVPASAGGTGVVASSAPPACADPGPFAYTPPEQKPLEAAGAHSPPGNASSPPSGKTPAAAMAPAKKP